MKQPSIPYKTEIRRLINQKAIDVSGAGDTAIGIFALALASGIQKHEAVVLASHACSIKVGKLGTSVVMTEELEASLANYVNPKQN